MPSERWRRKPVEIAVVADELPGWWLTDDPDARSIFLRRDDLERLYERIPEEAPPREKLLTFARGYENAHTYEQNAESRHRCRACGWGEAKHRKREERAQALAALLGGLFPGAPPPSPEPAKEEPKYLGRVLPGSPAICDECCNGDRCPGPPECQRFNRQSCPYCNKGWPKLAAPDSGKPAEPR